MTNEEAIINGVNFEETISEFELLFDEWHNKEFCTMTRIRDYAEYYKEENTKLKAEIEQLKKQRETRIKVSEANFNIYSKLEIERYNLKLEIEQLKLEVERYKKLIPKMCESCEYEDLLGYEEPCDACTHYSKWKLKCVVPE